VGGVYNHIKAYANMNILHVKWYKNLGHNFVIMSQPHFGQVWGWNSHSQSWGLGVLRDSQKLRAWLQGSKQLSLECSWYHWKGLEVKMSKMALHESFGHLKPKLWAKERLGVKLAIWLSITKSKESTQTRCAMGECNMALESSRGELQDWFRPRHNWRSRREVMMAQNPESANRKSFGTSLWESRDKEALGRGHGGATQRILYGGRWWLPPSPDRGEWSESKVARGLSQHQKGVEWVLTNLWLVLDAGSNN
jgi:hypothetical protein